MGCERGTREQFINVFVVVNLKHFSVLVMSPFPTMFTLPISPYTNSISPFPRPFILASFSALFFASSHPSFPSTSSITLRSDCSSRLHLMRRQSALRLWRPLLALPLLVIHHWRRHMGARDIVSKYNQACFYQSFCRCECIEIMGTEKNGKNKQ